MNLIATPVVGTKIVPQHKLHWRGGPAQLHLQRLRGNYQLPSHLMDQLTKRDRQRLDRSPRPDKTHRALAARVRLRQMLGQVMGLAGMEVELVSDAEGRPGLHPRYGISRTQLDFSISYGVYGFAACVAVGRHVGLDIERFTPKQADSFDKLFVSRQARRAQTHLDPQEIWTRMESYGKMQGEGLGYGMHQKGLWLTRGERGPGADRRAKACLRSIPSSSPWSPPEP
jgi:phosphopantetheinyl transferase